MNLNQKDRARGAIFRANSNLYFLEDCLEYVHRGGTDGAYSRSIYILLSYSVELILKAQLLVTYPDVPHKELQTHDLEKLFGMLSVGARAQLLLQNVLSKEDAGYKEYVFSFEDGAEMVIQDFVDVRYDFDKKALRPIDPNESARIKTEVERLLGISKTIMANVQN